MEQAKPLLELICNAENKEGRLVKGFMLPPEKEAHMQLALGTTDGILMYHTPLRNGKELPSFKKLTEAIDFAAKGDAESKEKALTIIDEFSQNSQILPFMDAIQEYIMERQSDIDPSVLMAFAAELFSKGTKRETVKLGLVLLGLFETESIPELKNFIRCIAACDEFTLYAMYIMCRWQDGNEAIFDIAQKTYGWGKIFAIQFLEPKTDEIRKWMIKEGVHNTVMPQYSALTVAEKCDLYNFMRGSITVFEFMGIVDVVAALLDEKPVPGISGVKDPQKFMEAFDECLIQNAAALKDQMTDAQRQHIDDVLKARSGR